MSASAKAAGSDEAGESCSPPATFSTETSVSSRRDDDRRPCIDIFAAYRRERTEDITGATTTDRLGSYAGLPLHGGISWLDTDSCDS